jgi:hypothetical protein
MNYKRTVEDFKKCGSKSSTVYNLPYISDCVGGSDAAKALSCTDLAFPVPCGDGTCHANYISCLRSLADHVEALVDPDRSLPRAKESEFALLDTNFNRTFYEFNDRGKVMASW